MQTGHFLSFSDAAAAKRLLVLLLEILVSDLRESTRALLPLMPSLRQQKLVVVFSISLLIWLFLNIKRQAQMGAIVLDSLRVAEAACTGHKLPNEISDPFILLRHLFMAALARL